MTWREQYCIPGPGDVHPELDQRRHHHLANLQSAEHMLPPSSLGLMTRHHAVFARTVTARFCQFTFAVLPVGDNTRTS
jgi:hypothetical protein